MNVDLSRRGFLKLTGAGVAATSLGAMGFGEAEAAEVAHVRAFKLTSTTETRNTCPYCSVACGVILYSKGDVRKGEAAEIIHVEGDVDHPTNRGTLCPKGAALKDFIHAPTRLTEPRYRAPGSRPLRADHLGRGARQDRPGDEGRPRRQPRRRRTRRACRSTAGRPPASSPLPQPRTRPPGRPPRS